MRFIPMPHLTDSDLERFWENIIKRGPNDCWRWLGSITQGGYGRITIQGKTYNVNRLSYYLDKGEDPGDCYVCHTCDTPSCVNPAHLWLGSQSDNMQDCSHKRRIAKGSRHGISKLTEVEVKEILESKETHQSIADTYGVSRSNIGLIKSGKRWKHLTREARYA